MLRITSRNFLRHIVVLAALSLSGAAAFGQSLGDVARQNQKKKAADPSAPAPKVITNADLPKDPDGYTPPPASENQPKPGSRAESKPAMTPAQQRAAEQWRQRIEAQKEAVSMLQSRIDTYKQTMPLTNASVGTGIPYTRYQATLVQMQTHLAQQQKKLEEMQEAARHAGMNATVYDP